MLSINVNAVWAAHNGVSVGLEAHESNAAPGMGLFLVTYPRLIAASVNAAAASDWVPISKRPEADNLATECSGHFGERG